jgi:hypothetical protein
MIFPALKKLTEIQVKQLEIFEAERYLKRLINNDKKIDCLIEISRLKSELIILLENKYDTK